LTCAEFSSFSLTISTNFVETLISPHGSPRILDNPVFITVFPVRLAIANYSDSMIDIVRIRIRTMAIVLGQYTCFVEIHASKIAVSGGAYWLLRQQFLETAIGDHVLFICLVVPESVHLF